MINANDLPAARAQAAAVGATAGSGVKVEGATELGSEDTRSTNHSRPSLSLHNGRYYVIDNKK